MSLRVLLIPEDGRYNGFIVKPLIERMLAECGRPNAKVRVLSDPRLSGYVPARQCVRTRFREQNMDDLWLFLPDADRAGGLEELEREASQLRISLICCAANPEVEAWLLAGHREKLLLTWSEVVAHPRLKEDVFVPFLEKHGNARRADFGRNPLMRETLAEYRGLLILCPELQDLERRICGLLNTRC